MVEEYWNLLHSPTKPEKPQGNTLEWKDVWIFVTNQCIWKNVCPWNSMNPNKKLKDKKEVLVNEVSPQIAKGLGD